MLVPSISTSAFERHLAQQQRRHAALAPRTADIARSKMTGCPFGFGHQSDIEDEADTVKSSPHKAKEQGKCLFSVRAGIIWHIVRYMRP